MAGVAAESAAGDDAEGLFAQGLGHQGHQTIQLQLGGVRMLCQLGPQEQFPAEPGKVGSGILKFSVFAPWPWHRVQSTVTKRSGRQVWNSSVACGNTTLFMCALRWVTFI